MGTLLVWNVDITDYGASPTFGPIKDSSSSTLAEACWAAFTSVSVAFFTAAPAIWEDMTILVVIHITLAPNV